MTSYQALINEITDFYDNHIQVKKVGSDFKEQMFNFATKDEKYPIVYIVPVSALATENTNDFILEIYCFDLDSEDKPVVQGCASASVRYNSVLII